MEEQEDEIKKLNEVSFGSNNRRYSILASDMLCVGLVQL